MATLVAKTLYTPEDLLTIPDGDRYELVDGKLVETTMSGLSSLVAARLLSRLDRATEDANLGFVFGADCTYQCFPHAPNRVRKPDVSFVRLGRVSLEDLEAGHVRVAPDIAAEIVSPNDVYTELNEKIEDYLRAGVLRVWVIDPHVRTVTVHRPDGNDMRLREPDELTGEDVLPAFRCRVGEIFPPASK